MLRSVGLALRALLGQGGELYSVAAFAALCLFVAIGLARSPNTLIEAVYRSLKR